MRRAFIALIGFMLLGPVLSGTSAQTTASAERGDPPIASLISISPPDDAGFVTISGSPGSVFPGAQVAVRNLFTEDVVYTQAGLTGAFNARLYGPGNTPFWISPAPIIPDRLRNVPGSLPGGPGAIIYGTIPEARQPGARVTRIVIDGHSDEWLTNYPDAALSTAEGQDVFALANQESLYVAFSGGDRPDQYNQIEIVFTLEGTTYALRTDPRQMQPAVLERTAPEAAPIGEVVIAVSHTDATELRMSFAPLRSLLGAEIDSATLESIRLIDEGASETTTVPVGSSIPLRDEVDGVVRLDERLADDFTRFTISGPVAQGAARWNGRGRVNRLDFQPGDELILELDITLTAPNLPEQIVDMTLTGDLSLQPVINAQGTQGAVALNSNNGWSNFLTPGGLAVDNLVSDIPLGQATVGHNNILRRGADLAFGLTFALNLPDDLPPGRYVPTFEGRAQIGDGDPFRWTDNGPFGSGPGISRAPLTRLPVVLSVGQLPAARLVWALFMDDPGDGNRGLLAQEDQGMVALSNRVRFNSPTYILPRGSREQPARYPIEPYLLNQLPNAEDTSAAPLIPFLLPGGRIQAQVTRPDGVVDDLGSTAIMQSQLSTVALEERTRFGADSPIDVYRLTTLNENFTGYPFDQYGLYQIRLSGNLEDIWGNRYEGGGTYSVLIAELLDLTPGVLPGTPFEAGDALNTGVRLTPGVPADVTVRVRVFPLRGGAPVEQIFEGRANRYGYFNPGMSFALDTPGEYVIDYEARYTDPNGRLWAASLRSAGVIAAPTGSLIAHGQRGLAGLYADMRPAWFFAEPYAQAVGAPDAARLLNFPYNSGDIVRIRDGAGNGFRPALRVQDRSGAYGAWLVANAEEFEADSRLSLQRLAVEDELPVITLGAPDARYRPALQSENILNHAYGYISAVRPDVTARQLVFGAEDGGLSLRWNLDDPYNGQLGAGLDGDRPGDYLFLFGGAVVRNAEAGIEEAAIYAALAIVLSRNDQPGSHVAPPFRGEAGGPDTGPLFAIRGDEVELFFHPTSIQPGQRLAPGDTLAIAGQVAPTLPSIVTVTITSPRGATHNFEGVANAIGYFYDASNDIVVDEAGVWTVDIRVQHEGLTSYGPVEPPFPTGGVLGVGGGSFPIFVVPEDAESLPWNLRTEFNIPATLPYNFNLSLPNDLTNRRIYRVVTTPGAVLENSVRDALTDAFQYQYNPELLRAIFPNLENQEQRRDGEGPAASDVITVTIAVTGLDSTGAPRIQTRAFTILHDRLITLS